MKESRNVDHTARVVIVGAGPAGSVTAAALAERGVDTLLLDQATFPREKTCGDGLTPRSVAMVQQMGLLSRLEESGGLRINGVRVYAPDGRFAEVGMDELGGELPPFGLTVRRHELDALLVEHAQAAGARFLASFRVSALTRSDGAVAGVQGTVPGGEHTVVRASLVCLATGVATALVKKAGLLSAVMPVIRAVRAYYENVADLAPIFQLHYDRCFLPGYGWIFPLSGRRANVGVGCFPSGRFRRRTSPPLEMFRRFVNLNPRCSAQLASAIAAGPIESRPLRVHFPTMQTQADNLLLVGEAAGLVNPFNGEGVGFAMESGLLAAEVAAEALADGDLSAGRLAIYGRCLRERYLSLFSSLSKMRDWYIRERALNLIIGKAQKRPRLAQLLVGAALGVVDPMEAVSWPTLRDIVR